MGILDSLFGKKNYFGSYGEIARTRVIKGISFPSFIKKEDKYTFSELEVFEDGVFYCNDFVDQPLLKERLEEQWLNYKMPEGERFTINGLGSLCVNNSTWDIKDDKTFYKLMKKFLKELNPSLKNMYDFFGDNTQDINGVKVPIFKKNSYSIYEEEISQINNKQIKGKMTNIFYQENGKTFLGALSVFEDGTVKITRVPDVMKGTVSEIDRMFEEGALKTTLQNEERITILGLGEFTTSESEMVSSSEKIQEIHRFHEELKNE